MKILVVDDVAAMRMTIAKILEIGGQHDVIDAASGTEAMGMLDDIDLILADLLMPGMHGLSFIRAVSESSKHSHIPIIVITAVNDSEELERAAALGVVDCILKPFSAQFLLGKIRVQEEALRRRRREKTMIR